MSLAEQVPIPVNYLFTADNIIENTQDHILPPNVLTFKDLGIEPSKVTEGFPIEHLRHYRVGGYDFGRLFSLSAVFFRVCLAISEGFFGSPGKLQVLRRQNKDCNIA